MAAPMNLIKLCTFSRLELVYNNAPVVVQRVRQFHAGGYPLLFRLSPTLGAEPIKKKRKIDPNIVRLREDRKRRKLEKDIRRLEKVCQKLKPIDELDVSPKLLQERKLRERKQSPLSEEEIDYRSWILKEWSNYKREQYLAETGMIDRMMAAQSKALEELKIISEDLYEEALQPDPILMTSYKMVGPVYTPPIENYIGLDGDYTDVTKKWD